MQTSSRIRRVHRAFASISPTMLLRSTTSVTTQSSSKVVCDAEFMSCGSETSEIASEKMYKTYPPDFIDCDFHFHSKGFNSKEIHSTSNEGVAVSISHPTNARGVGLGMEEIGYQPCSRKFQVVDMGPDHLRTHEPEKGLKPTGV